MRTAAGISVFEVFNRRLLEHIHLPTSSTQLMINTVDDGVLQLQ